MRIGVGLPTTTPGAHRELLLAWSRRAEAAEFSSIAVLDRLLYDSYDPFIALAAAAAVTQRIRVATMIAIGPLRARGILAKQSASLAALARGRLTLGLGVGARDDDYAAAGVELRGRGDRFNEQLAFLRGPWRTSGIGPGGEHPQLLVGGLSGAAFVRMARYADGYAHNGGPPRAFAGAAARARAAWRDLDRPGEPALWGQAYFALGREDDGAQYLRDYYAFTGPFAEKIVAANLTTARSIKELVRGYADEGCDELVLFPTVSSLDQLDRLHEVLS